MPRVPDAVIDAIGLVAFAHGTGSSRHSSRNRFVAAELQRASLGTLPMDLLTPAEERIDDRTRALTWPRLARDWFTQHLAQRGHQ